MKVKNENIIWQIHGRNYNTGFVGIETPDEFIILQNKVTKQFITVNKSVQNKLLSEGKACYHTDTWWEKPNWFDDCFYGHNNIKLGGKIINRKEFFTLGQALKRIRKVEFLFPEGTELDIQNNYYLRLKNGGSEGLNVKYKTSRKFKGFKNDIFRINKPSLFNNFKRDELLGKLISFLRTKGFIIFVNNTDNDYVKYGDSPDCKIALGYGHGYIIGISEFSNYYNGYSYGKENILVDLDNHFNKWSQTFEIPKPKSEDDFENILDEILSVKKHYTDEE